MTKYTDRDETDQPNNDPKKLGPAYEYAIAMAMLEEQKARHELERDRIAQKEGEKNRRNKIIIAITAGVFSLVVALLPTNSAGETYQPLAVAVALALSDSDTDESTPEDFSLTLTAIAATPDVPEVAAATITPMEATAIDSTATLEPQATATFALTSTPLPSQTPQPTNTPGVVASTCRQTKHQHNMQYLRQLSGRSIRLASVNGTEAC